MFTKLRGLRPNFSRSTSNGPPKKKKKETIVLRRKGEYVYGVAPCTAALQAKRRKVYAVYQKVGCIDKKTASKRAALGGGKIHKMAEELKADFRLVDRDTLDRLTGGRPHQGIVLDVAPLNFRRMDFTECKLSEKERGKNPVWLLLDQVQDPMNLGAIVRCAYYLGVSRMIASLKRCCPLSPVVSKASAGAMELMPVHAVSNLGKFLKEAKTQGWSILGSSGPDIPESDDEDEEEDWQENTKKKIIIPSINCYEYTKQGPTLLALGNEGHGLHREVKEECDAILTVTAHRLLPQGFDCLNVGVATGILLHSLQRKQ